MFLNIWNLDATTYRIDIMRVFPAHMHSITHIIYIGYLLLRVDAEFVHDAANEGGDHVRADQVHVDEGDVGVAVALRPPIIEMPLRPVYHETDFQIDQEAEACDDNHGNDRLKVALRPFMRLRSL